MSGTAALRWDGVSKSYGETKALDGFSLEVPTGSVFGLLGRNGTGKTTAIRILVGLLRPDGGKSEVLGSDSLSLPREVRTRIGYLSEAPFPYDDLAMPKLLKFVSAFFPDWDFERSERLADRMKVRRDLPLSKMSKGERRRAELFLVLAQDAEILVLDDPWLGLDAAARREFLWTALDVAQEEGKTMLFTSHVLTDVERIVDRVAIMEAGRVKLADDLDVLKSRTKRLVLDLPPGVEGRDVVIPGEVSRTKRGGAMSIVTGGFSDGLLVQMRGRFPEIRVEDLNLEEIFCELTTIPESPSVVTTR